MGPRTMRMSLSGSSSLTADRTISTIVLTQPSPKSASSSSTSYKTHQDKQFYVRIVHTLTATQIASGLGQRENADHVQLTGWVSAGMFGMTPHVVPFSANTFSYLETHGKAPARG
jgi:hypothetical protein